MHMPKNLRLAAAGLARALAGGAFAQQTPAAPAAPAAPDWCRSKYGANDEIGAANLLSPELALAAARLVRTGKTYALGGETNAKTPAFAPRTWALTVLQPGQAGGGSLGPTKTNYNDDIYTGWVGTGTQLDGLGHIGVDNVYYNCLRNSEFVQASGLTKLGIEKVPPFVTRGVVLDMAAFFGVEMMREGQVFNRAEIEEQAKRQGVEIRRGDVVLFHTGWQRIAASDPARFVKGEPGLGREGAQWLAGKQVVAVGADTWALEAIPFEQGAGIFEVHQILIPRNGIYILENVQTE